MDADELSGVAINVGSQTKYHGRGPLHADGSFEYVPIPERDSSVETPTYGELGIEAEIVQEHQDVVAHFDPEFPELELGQHYTYADPTDKKRRCLKKLSQGDYVFFYGTFDFVDEVPEHYWINTDWGGYIFGHFRLAVDPIIGKDAYAEASEEVREALDNNAHLRRETLDDDIVFLLGDPSRSELYDVPTPLSLPGEGLGAADRANRVLDMAGTDPQGVWYRGPLEFNEDVTDLLLRAHQNGTYGALIGEPLSNQPGFDDFVSELYSPDEFAELDRYSESEELSEDTRLLSAFLYIAGGWSPSVPEVVIEHSEAASTPLEGLVDDESLRDELTRTFQGLREADWPHGHRTNIPREAGRLRPQQDLPLEPYITEVLMNAVESLAGITPDITTLVHEWESEPDPFDAAMHRLQRISSFGRLAAFDLLEVLVRGYGLNQLGPKRLKKKYIDSSGPKDGFEHVFGEPLEGAITDAARVRYLTQLVGYACEEHDMSHVDAIFAAESALCNCQKGRSHTELTEMGFVPEEPIKGLDEQERSDWNC